MDRSAKRLELKQLLGGAEMALVAVTEALSDSQLSAVFEKILRELQISESQIQEKTEGKLRSSNILLPKGISMNDAEREIVRSALEYNNWNKTQTAAQLGIGRKTLHRKIEEFDL